MKTTRAKALAAVLAATVLALAGCMSIEANVDVSKDNKINGTMSVKMSKQLASMVGITSADALKQQMDSQGDTPQGLTYETSEDDQNYIITMKGDLSDTDGMMTATSSGEVQTFTVTNTQSDQAGGASTAPTDSAEPSDSAAPTDSAEPTDTASPSATDSATDGATALPSEIPSDLASLLPSEIASALPTSSDTENPFNSLVGDYKLEVTANFAGTVTAVDGPNATKVDEDTVKFSGPMAEKWTSSATIDLASGPLSAGGSGISPMILLFLGLLLLMFLAIVVILVVMKSRKPKAPAQPMAPPGWGPEGAAAPEPPYGVDPSGQTAAYPTQQPPMAPPTGPAYPTQQPPMAPPAGPAYPTPAGPAYPPTPAPEPPGQAPTAPQYGSPQPPAAPQYGAPPPAPTGPEEPPAPPQYPPAPPQ